MGILDTEPHEPHAPRRQINWSAVAVFVTVTIYALAAASGVFGDYRQIGNRVTILETLRESDAVQRERMELKLDKLDDKMDRIIEQRRDK